MDKSFTAVEAEAPHCGSGHLRGNYHIHMCNIFHYLYIFYLLFPQNSFIFLYNSNHEKLFCHKNMLSSTRHFELITRYFDKISQTFKLFSKNLPYILS